MKTIPDPDSFADTWETEVQPVNRTIANAPVANPLTAMNFIANAFHPTFSSTQEYIW
jgi:hypothetical protein